MLISGLRSNLRLLNTDDFNKIMKSKKEFVKFTLELSGNFSFLHYSFTSKSGVGLCDIDEVRDILKSQKLA